MDVPLNEATFDALYSIEAICHAPDRLLAFRELFRLLKPGAEAAVIDWILTEKFDRSNREHNEICNQIEHNNAISQRPIAEKYIEALQTAGFEVIETQDLQTVEGDPLKTWYMALQGRDFSLSSFARTPVGRLFIAKTTRILEGLKLAPVGTSETSHVLNTAADALVKAGKLGIFTPSFLVHARKPA